MKNLTKTAEELKVTATRFLQKIRVENTLIFALGNGKRIVFNPANCTEKIRDVAMYHGFSQKIGDSVSGMSKGEEYSAAMARMGAVIEALEAGHWNVGKTEELGSLIEAIASVKKLDVALVEKAVIEASAEQRKAWAAHKAVRAKMLQIEADRLKANLGEEELAFVFSIEEDDA